MTLDPKKDQRRAEKKLEMLTSGGSEGKKKGKKKEKKKTPTSLSLSKDWIISSAINVSAKRYSTGYLYALRHLLPLIK